MVRDDERFRLRFLKGNLMSRELRRRVSLVGFTGALALTLVVGPHHHAVWAAPTPPVPTIEPTSVHPIERIDGASKPSKPPQKAVDPSTVGTVDDCTRRAYESLDARAAELAAEYGGDATGLASALAATKDAVVGQVALKKAGCKTPGEK